MKNFRQRKAIQLLFAFILLGFLSSCEDNLNSYEPEGTSILNPEQSIGYLTNAKGKNEISAVELRKEGGVDLYLSLSNSADENASVALKYDRSILDEYNANNHTNYELLPEKLVTFGDDLKISKGYKKSDKTLVKFISDPSLDEDKTYAIPVKSEVKSGHIKLAEKESNYIILVNDFSKAASAEKSTGIKIISCMEVNDVNPLNNLAFTLKGSGKPLVDIVILFSANINYNEQTGKVYVHNNSNVQHLLSNRNKYLKPLQDRGIKVVLGILGNHDRSGVANLADDTAKAFAQELKTVCDKYNLDGIFFDDEYSSYKNPPPAGFVYPSNKAASRLVYETKKAMPNKIVSVYVYSRTSSLVAVDGKQPGEYLDYATHDYLNGYDLSWNYPGLSRKGMALYSQEFNHNRWASRSNLKYIRQNGYGAHMIFAMDPFRSNFNKQKAAMEMIAEELFDDELEVSNTFYRKDW